MMDEQTFVQEVVICTPSKLCDNGLQALRVLNVIGIIVWIADRKVVLRL